MNVLVLNGSPKSDSNTMRLTRSFLDGIASGTTCDAVIVNVIEKDVRPCLGCFACWAKGDGTCVQNDDQNEILAAYLKADVAIWSFPLYCYSMPSHLKAVLDRTIPLIRLRMKEADGRVMHESPYDFSQKRHVVISGCGFPDWEGNFEPLRLMCRNSFGNLTMVCVPEAPLLNIPEAAPAALPLLDRFREAGHEYAQSGKLSADTVRALETPMISKEEYLRGVNS